MDATTHPDRLGGPVAPDDASRPTDEGPARPADGAGRQASPGTADRPGGHLAPWAPVVLAASGLGAVLVVLVLVAGADAGHASHGAGEEAGRAVDWILPLVAVLARLAGALTVGGVALAVAVLPRRTDGRSDERRRAPSGFDPESGLPSSRRGSGRRRARRVALPAEGPWPLTMTVAGVAGVAWTLCTGAQAVLSCVSAAQIPVSDPAFGAELASYLTQVSPGRALSAATVLAAVTCLAALVSRTYLGAVWTLVASLAALVPLAVAGHSGAGGHTLAMSALWMHLAAISVWIGGLAVLAVVRSRLGAALPDALARYSRMAGWCFGLVAISGLASASVHLEGPADLVTTPVGRLLAVKVLILLALGALGALQRRRVVARATDAGSRGLFARLAAVELVLLGVAAGLGSALDSVPGEHEGHLAVLSPVESLTGYPLPPTPTVATWFTQWHLDVLLGTACVVGAVVYVRWVVRLARRGDAWPVGRTVSWLAGMVSMFWVADGGPVVYGHLLFSAHMVLHMTVAMVIPILMVLGAPVTLLMRAVPGRRDGSRGPREWMGALVHSAWARFFAQPLVAAVNFVGSMVIFYFTPLFDLAMSTHAGHLVMMVHFTLAGYMFANVVVGVDPGPSRPSYPIRLLLLFCTMAFHAFFGIAIISSATLLAAPWFDMLGPVYGIDRFVDQAHGGAITWGIGEIPTLLLAIALAVAWARDDERRARRTDRAADRDGDAELGAYNAMLAGLARRDD